VGFVNLAPPSLPFKAAQMVLRNRFVTIAVIIPDF
jgi:hypothetical protein